MNDDTLLLVVAVVAVVAGFGAIAKLRLKAMPGTMGGNRQDPGARVPCPSCRELVMPGATVCPHCRRDIPLVAGQPVASLSHQSQQAMGGLVALVIFGAGAWFFFGGGMESQAAKSMSQIQNQVAEDAVQQYRIAERGGTAMDRCVQAGFVVAAYLQAQNEERYRAWQQTEARDCRAAGVPR